VFIADVIKNEGKTDSVKLQAKGGFRSIKLTPSTELDTKLKASFKH